MNEANLPTDLLTPNEAAELLGVSSNAVRVWVHTGKLPAFKVVGRLRVSKADALAMVQRIEVDGKPTLPTKAEATAKAMRVDKVLRDAGIRR